MSDSFDEEAIAAIKAERARVGWNPDIRVELTREAVKPLPASIHQATVAVMKATRTIAHDAENSQDGGYSYSSVDAIYEALHAALAEAGLLVIALEDKVERFVTQSGKPAIDTEWSFVLATETDTWEVPGRLKRTVALLYRGAQSHQSAQSFAEKAFLRSWFKLATGERDDTDVEDIVQPEDKPPAKKAPKKAAHAFDAEAEAKRLLGLIRDAKTVEHLAKVVEDNASDFQAIDGKLKEQLLAAHKAKKIEIAKASTSGSA